MVLEVVERLAPTPATLRILYVHSGNRCAFEGCDRVLVNAKGQWVGEVCHIEAAMPGGARFNPNMTNDERRRPENLLLMCHEHHVETNDVEEFSVERLREIKLQHENRYRDARVPHEENIEQVVNDIVQSAITDMTESVKLQLPQTLAGYNTVLNLGLTPEELRGTAEELSELLETLRRLPVDARAVFAIAVDRSHEGSATLPVHEIEQVAGLEPRELYLHITTLERYGIAYLDEHDLGEDRPPVQTLRAGDLDGWDFWPEFKAFCEVTGRPVRKTINELRFDILDAVPENNPSPAP